MFEKVVDMAKFAPSAHNTQPVRWALDGTDGIIILADLSRRLPVADSDDRDLMIACGAAIEGTVLALATGGQGATVEVLTQPDANGLRPIARVTVQGDADPADVLLAGQVPLRLTHRLGFAPKVRFADQTLQGNGVTCVTQTSEIGWLAQAVDRASARLMRDHAFRAELLAWMRLWQHDPRYDLDGLNREALGMDRLTATLTQPVLGRLVYPVLSMLGLGPTLAGEAAKTRTASALLLFHWPKDGSLLDAGRAFYRTWLQATELGLAGWPAAALADDPRTAARVAARFGLPENHRFYNALRLGPAKGATPQNVRLATNDVIVSGWAT